jgi:hypothetical protein
MKDTMYDLDDSIIKAVGVEEAWKLDLLCLKVIKFQMVGAP